MAKAAKAAIPTGPALAMVTFEGGNSKNALAAAGASNGKISMVPVTAIKVAPGFNIRAVDSPGHEESILELQRSIVKEGFYPGKPLTGFISKATVEGESDSIVVLDGHRRLEAVNRAIAAGATDITMLPVILTTDIDPVSVNVALIKGNTGAPLSMAEKAVVVKRLLKHGMTKSEIASRLDMTDRYVEDLQILIESPKTVRAAVKADKISGTEAVKILRKHARKNEDDPKAAAKAAEAEVTSMMEKAAARGATRASAQDSDAGTRDGAKQVKVTDAETGEEKIVKIKPMVHKTSWAVSAGDEFPLKGTEFKLLGKLPGDSDWYTLIADKDGYAKALEDVTFEVKITRPKKPDPVKAVKEKMVGAPARKKAKPAVEEGLPEAEVTPTDDDLFGDETPPTPPDEAADL